MSSVATKTKCRKPVMLIMPVKQQLNSVVVIKPFVCGFVVLDCISVL